MKTAVALCFLAVFCTDSVNSWIFDTSNLDILRAGVQKSKTTVQNAVQKLERLQSNTEEDTVMKVTNKNFEQMKGYIDYSNEVLDTVRQVKNAKAKGENAQPCYDTALNTLRNIVNAATADGQRCVDTAKSSIKSDLAFIDTCISTGCKLKATLDSIFLNCYNSDIIKMNSCFTIQVVQTNVLVRSFENEVDSVENTARSASTTVFVQGSKCLYNVYSSARSQVTEVNLAASKCLNDL